MNILTTIVFAIGICMFVGGGDLLVKELRSGRRVTDLVVASGTSIVGAVMLIIAVCMSN